MDCPVATCANCQHEWNPLRKPPECPGCRATSYKVVWRWKTGPRDKKPGIATFHITAAAIRPRRKRRIFG
jgi:hypothetical protein